MLPEGADYLPPLPLDQPVPRSALGRRDGISFCSSTSYLTEPRFGRRGGISFDQKDKNARYVRMLGDVRIRPTTRSTLAGSSQTPSLEEADRLALDHLGRDGTTRRLRRFYSPCPRHRNRWLREFHGETDPPEGHEGGRPPSNLPPHSLPDTLLDTHYLQQAQVILARVDRWDFNIFGLDTFTRGQPIPYMGLQLFQKYDLINLYRLDYVRLIRTFMLLQEGYHENNYYHTAVHAADVAQAMHCYLQETKLQECVSPFEVMIALLSAICHDVDHPGFNQTFLIKTENYMAHLYNDQSVLENHHFHYATSVLRETGLLSHLDRDLQDQAAFQMNSLILATDISRQQEFVQRFKEYLDNNDFDVFDNAAHRHFALQIALKCADISNPSRPWRVSEIWSRRVCREFFYQGDMERKLGVPVTPVCDRINNTVARIQWGFFEFVVEPLFKQWDRFVESRLSQLMLDHVEQNKSKWKAEIQRETAARAAETNQAADSTPPVVSAAPADDKADAGDDKESEDVDDEEDDVVVESDVNLQFAYDVDSSSETTGGTSLRSLSPLIEDAWRAHALLDSRRHSMPPAQVITELGFYLGFHSEPGKWNPRGRYLLGRRGSLPVPASAFYASHSESDVTGNALSPGGRTMQRLLPEAIRLRTRIPSLVGTLDPRWRAGVSVRTSDPCRDSLEKKLPEGAEVSLPMVMLPGDSEVEEEGSLEDEVIVEIEQPKGALHKGEAGFVSWIGREDSALRGVPGGLTSKSDILTVRVVRGKDDAGARERRTWEDYGSRVSSEDYSFRSSAEGAVGRSGSVDLGLGNTLLPPGDPGLRRRVSVPRSITEARSGRSHTQHVVAMDTSITRFSSASHLDDSDGGEEADLVAVPPPSGRLEDDHDLQLWRQWARGNKGEGAEEHEGEEGHPKDRASSWPSLTPQSPQPPTLAPGTNGAVSSKLQLLAQSQETARSSTNSSSKPSSLSSSLGDTTLPTPPDS